MVGHTESLHFGYSGTAVNRAQARERLRRIRVEDLMTREVITLEKEQAVPLAQELMRMLHIRNLPVVDEKGTFVGLVTQPSLLAAQVELLSELNEDDPVERELSVPVAKVMTTSNSTVTPNTPAADALQLLVDRKESSIPVVDSDGKVVGIVTVKDFLALALKNLRESENTSVSGVAAAVSSSTTAPWLLWLQHWTPLLLVGIILVFAILLIIREFTVEKGGATPAAVSDRQPTDGAKVPSVAHEQKAPPAETQRAARPVREERRRTTSSTSPRSTAGRTQADRDTQAAAARRQRAAEEAIPPIRAPEKAAESPRRQRWVPEPIPDPL